MEVTESKEDPHVVIDLAEDGRYVSRKLLDLAGLNDREVKTRLALALGRIGDPAGITTLKKLASDDAAQVRSNAYFSLGLIGGQGVEEVLLTRLALEDSVEMITPCITALGRISEKNAPKVLKEYFKHKDARIRAAAFKALGLFGAKGKLVSDEVLNEASLGLKDDLEQVRFMSAFALFRVKKPSAGPAIAVAALRNAVTQDDSPDVRAYAMQALVRRGGLDMATFEKALHDKNDRVAAQAVLALKFLEDVPRCAFSNVALEYVAKQVGENADVQRGTFSHVIITALETAAECSSNSKIKSKAADIYKASSQIPVLERTASTSKSRCLACLVAGYSNVSVVACDPARPYAGKRMLAQKLGNKQQTTPEAVKLLSEMLKDPDPRVVIAALDSLGPVSMADAKNAVISAFDHRNPLVISAVFDTLAMNATNFATQSGVIKAMELAIDRYLPFEHAQTLLVSAAFALARLNLPGSIKLLSQLAVDPRPAVRNSVLTAFKSIKKTPPDLLTPIRAARPVTSEEKMRWRNQTVEASVITTKGSFIIELHNKVAPATVASFALLATEGYFDDSEIHRVVPNFVVQAGDPTGTGLGDPNYLLRCEVSPLPYVRGTVGMALAGKDTGGSQFFVTLSPQPHLDENYTVFGTVISGMDVVDLIEEGDSILSVLIELTPST